MISKIIRFAAKISFNVSNACRKRYLQLKYPGLKIDHQSIIEKGCKIVCVDGGEMDIINSYISAGAYILADKAAVIRIDNAFIGQYTHIVSKAAIEIQFGVSIAEMVVIRDQDHIINQFNKTNGVFEYNVAPINIGERAWIASKATILKGVDIGACAAVGAAAVVTKSIPPNELWAGVPAVFVKKLS